MEINEECRKLTAHEKSDAYIVIRHYENQISRAELLKRIVKAHRVVQVASQEDVG